MFYFFSSWLGHNVGIKIMTESDTCEQSSLSVDLFRFCIYDSSEEMVADS